MPEPDVDNIISAIRTVLPSDRKGLVALHEPCFNGNEWAYVKDCIDSSWVSYVGQYVDRFETMIADFTGVKKAVAVVNGTAALQIALQLAGVEPGDEVLVPALTFIATANAVVHCRAIPHFADSEEKTLGLDPFKLEDYLKDACRVGPDGSFNRRTGRRIKAIIPMHAFGHPVDLDSLADLCRKFKLEMIEDAAESLGSFYKGRHTGNWGKLSILSFNGNKTITTGGGGAILTHDESLAKQAKHLTSTAKVPHRWEYRHDHIGYNYRLPNLNAALGCAQMEQLSGFLEKKRELAAKYHRAFQNVSGIQFFNEPPDCKSNYWLNVLLLQEASIQTRNELLDRLNEAGLMARPAWTLLHKLEMFQNCPRMDLSGAEDLEARLINIPSSSFLGEKNA